MVTQALDDAQGSVLVLSKLRQGPLSRTDLLAQLVCQVDNGMATPVRTTVRVDMRLAPLTVRILRASGGALTAGLPVELVCEARGSRPPAQITWWKRGVQLAQSFGHASADGNVSTSVVSFMPTAEDHGQGLRCVARNPALPPSAPAPHDRWAMNVFCPRVRPSGLGPLLLFVGVDKTHRGVGFRASGMLRAARPSMPGCRLIHTAHRPCHAPTLGGTQVPLSAPLHSVNSRPH
ncbi:hypothetical protein HPB48_001264 [Haemaphysalis longicornis]|uniref:Ig-like domain-containing protein n=1 Tax=Haemaphysalis longicornis TaxID=44386 RepID=A0A9J6FIJ2_HAELO|nr:hypothetical protein HPB48_001264 [Haemaphysalis longicornis]